MAKLHAYSGTEIPNGDYIYTDINSFKDFFEMIAFLPKSDMFAMSVGDLQQILGIKEGDRVTNIYSKS